MNEANNDAALVTRDAVFPAIFHERKRLFLWTYATTGQGKLRRTSRLTQIPPETHYRWLDTDPDYAAAFAKAYKLSGDYLEEEVLVRATEGERPSDLLLIFALKAKRPEYRDNWHLNVEHSGQVLVSIEDRTRQANERLARLRRQSQEVIDVTPTPLPPGETP